MSPEEIENINVLSPNGLKTLRKRLGLKQADAASALGVSSNAYCKKEMGLRSISRADTLAMLYLESLADRETLFGVSDALQAACVAVEKYASNAKLRALKVPVCRPGRGNTEYDPDFDQPVGSKMRGGAE